MGKVTELGGNSEFRSAGAAVVALLEVEWVVWKAWFEKTLLVWKGASGAISLVAKCWPEVSKMRGRDGRSIGKEKGCGLDDGLEKGGLVLTLEKWF